jgi:hypothetical protein
LRGALGSCPAERRHPYWNVALQKIIGSLHVHASEPLNLSRSTTTSAEKSSPLVSPFGWIVGSPVMTIVSIVVSWRWLLAVQHPQSPDWYPAYSAAGGLG